MAKNAVVSAVRALKACSLDEQKTVLALLKAEQPKAAKKSGGKKSGKKKKADDTEEQETGDSE